MLSSAIPAAAAPVFPVDLVGLLPADFTVLMAKLDEKPFRARQLWHWIYHRGATDFATMTNLPNACRKKLAEHCIVSRPQISRAMVASSDFTHKWLLRFSDGREVETVYIPGEGRGTVCVSSQVGCTLTCRFCHTGTQKLARNLGAAEIIGQLLLAKDAYSTWPSSNQPPFNVVMMGMGEPLLNYSNVATALKILMNPDGLAVSHRRVTVSTAGVAPMIRRLGEEVACNLAVSLHAATDTVRDVLMPINKKYPLATLMTACRNYKPASNAHRITFEYIMLKGINDSESDARAVVRLVNGVPCKFNLIPFNPWPGAPYTCSAETAIHRFAAILNDAGYSAPTRMARGREICAACGQLQSALPTTQS
ncbi:Ribosomal RNA large subunit methyltransferase N [invertebrate metagenome]|uniref:Ribosomal RNA large subunit methyltransferase N n=1 Tax=invertebrate metagenome TaxID=1711999 RepID=A0A484H6C5_9ZZZZ